MAKTPEATVTFYTGTFPNTAAVNATGAGTADGTEWVKVLIDNFLFGPMQAWYDYASVTPDGVTEAAGSAQSIEVVTKGLGDGPGTVKMYHFNNTFTALGYRILPLNGQGILRASYPELDSITYVGDANNAAVAAAGGGYYRADDAAGTIPNIAGIYLILPESRGYTVRGLDTAASVDPGGASRYLGDNQSFALENITGSFQSRSLSDGTQIPFGFLGAFQDNGSASSTGTATKDVALQPYKIVGFDASNVVQTSTETRMVNFSVNFGVVY